MGFKGRLFLVLASTLFMTVEGAWAQSQQAAGSAQQSAAQAGQPAAKQTLYYIPHTHWEGAVFFTREEYLDQGLPFILTAIRLLEKYPDYHFTLDQVAYFKPFIERYPEEAAAFRKFAAEGRLQIVGGMDVMPDDVKPGGELFVRGMQYGKGYCRKELGVDVTAAWLLDTFGHHPQMPQLLKLAGFKSLWFCRGIPNDNVPMEFFWRGIDGTQIMAIRPPIDYGLFYGPPKDLKGFSRMFEERFRSLDAHAGGRERPGLAGPDVCPPEEYVPPLVQEYNQRPDAPFTIRYAGPMDYEKAVAKRKDLPVVDGDFNPIFQGTYSSRPELHQVTRETEQKLLTAEKLGAISNWLGTPTDDAALWQAWEPLLFNQAHDLASGVMTDPVYQDTVRSYEFSKRLANDMIAVRWNNVAAHIDTRGDGVPVVVFNMQGWTRTDAAEVDVGFAGEDVRDVEVVGPAGEAVTAQVSPSEQYVDGTIRRAKVAFVARDVPALGYATYHIVARKTARTSKPAAGDVNSIENEYYKLAFDLESGEITSLFDKTLHEEVFTGPANVVSRQEDKGDLWEINKPLDGGMYIGATTRQPVPTSSTATLSIAFSDKPGSIHRGPVFSEFSVSHPLSDGTFATRVRLWQGVRRVDFETQLVNNTRHVRYQVLFPTKIKDAHNVQEIPFGAVERPIGVEYPAQNWVDIADGRHGVALLNVGLAGNVVSDGTLMLSLLRSQDLIGYNLGRPSDSGFELGVQRTFRYALVPHAGDWRQARVYRHGLEFNSPLLVRKVTAHSGDLPRISAMVEISSENVVLTAFKPGPGNSTILRVYEASGTATPGVKIRLHAKVTRAQEADLLEEARRDLKCEDDAVQVDLRPFEILTIKLALAGKRS